MTMHTKGPWKVERSRGCFAIRPDRGDMKYGIAHVFASRETCINDPDEGEANAMLMAASLDMLEALKGILPLLDDSMHFTKEGWIKSYEPKKAILEAIAKAKIQRG